MTFKDHFSEHASLYTQFRPRYPRELFEYLASLVLRRKRAWDCGTGNGQAAVELAKWFDEVVATDPSAKQIAEAEPNDKVEYLVAPAEQSPLADASVDLVSVAQALHWFDFDRFYAEVRRVARPHGVLAAWSYGLTLITPEIDRVVWHLYSDLLGPYWPPERRLVEEKYATIPFPFDELPAPEVAMTARWSLDDLVGYLRTWSSAQKYIARHGNDPIAQVQADLTRAWGQATSRQVQWPLYVRVGRVLHA